MKAGWAIGALVLACLPSSPASPPYPPPEWSSEADAVLKALFEKESGARFAAVQWRYAWFDENNDGKSEKAVQYATVLGEAKPLSPRLRKGLSLSFFKEPIGADAWWPGKPFRWAREKKRTDYGSYVTVSPRPDDSMTKKYPELARRIYDQPIFVGEAMDADQLVALVDFLWRQQTVPEEPGGFIAPVSSMRDDSGNPFWSNLSTIADAAKIKEIAGSDHSVRKGDVVLGLPQDGDGYLALIVRRKGSGFEVVREIGVDF